MQAKVGALTIGRLLPLAEARICYRGGTALIATVFTPREFHACLPANCFLNANPSIPAFQILR
jgi:hypothetical protein